MPLPAALAAKLAKRGILQNKHRGVSTTTSSNATFHAASTFPPGYTEEVFAEDYDDEETDLKEKQKAENTIFSGITIPKLVRLGHFGCPNKYNIYHRCGQYCVNRWGRGRATTTSQYNARRLKMIRKYPLPSDWQEVYDPGCAKYYYWNTLTDDVSWLCPKHPKAIISRPASEIRVKIIVAAETQQITSGKNANPPQIDQNIRKRKDDLDPMDPASYSDIPRGDWHSGLEKSSDAKTGVDTTASGPLFQSRPYPNPGAILRANASTSNQSKKKKKKF